MPAVKKKDDYQIKNLVFSGGAFKAYALFGVHAAMEELGILDQVEAFTGNSAGSGMAIVMALKYTPDELYSFITDFEYQKLKNWNFMNILSRWGIEAGDRLEKFMRMLLVHKINKPDPTFQDVYDYNPVLLTVTATKLNTHETINYNHINTPDASVARTFRKSIAFPGLIAPVFEFEDYYDEETEQHRTRKVTYVDGALIDNFPIHLHPDKPDTVGVLLEHCHHDFREVNDLEQYITQLFQCKCSSVTHEKVKKIKKAQIIHLLVDENQSFNVSQTVEDKEIMFKLGYDETTKHFKKYLANLARRKKRQSNAKK